MADGTPLSQSPTCGKAEERAWAQVQMEGADEMKRSNKVSSTAYERECWCKGTSMSSKLCQSGLDAAEERAGKVELT